MLIPSYIAFQHEQISANSTTKPYYNKCEMLLSILGRYVRFSTVFYWHKLINNVPYNTNKGQIKDKKKSNQFMMCADQINHKENKSCILFQ